MQTAKGPFFTMDKAATVHAETKKAVTPHAAPGPGSYTPRSTTENISSRNHKFSSAARNLVADVAISVSKKSPGPGDYNANVTRNGQQSSGSHKWTMTGRPESEF